ncbi:MAG: metal-sensitive transcriptional regulator [Bdellovibrionaceae bacterium]|nr:metal-sensitive transcriptional regulator [Pseudobdellovibrionaceae bacterium]
MLEKEKAHGRSKKPAIKARDNHEAHDHPDHSAHIKRLNRVKGQIDGIERMMLDRRYCTDIIAQLRAASAALKAVESEVFKSHLRGCVKSALSGKDAFKAEEKIQEIIKLIY